MDGAKSIPAPPHHHTDLRLGRSHDLHEARGMMGVQQCLYQAGDEHKAAFKMRRGLYEPTVMFFSPTNSPTTFQAMMNALYRDTIQSMKPGGQ